MCILKNRKSENTLWTSCPLLISAGPLTTNNFKWISKNLKWFLKRTGSHWTHRLIELFFFFFFISSEQNELLTLLTLCISPLFLYLVPWGKHLMIFISCSYFLFAIICVERCCFKEPCHIFLLEASVLFHFQLCLCGRRRGALRTSTRSGRWTMSSVTIVTGLWTNECPVYCK